MDNNSSIADKLSHFTDKPLPFLHSVAASRKPGRLYRSLSLLATGVALSTAGCPGVLDDPERCARSGDLYAPLTPEGAYVCASQDTHIAACEGNQDYNDQWVDSPQGSPFCNYEAEFAGLPCRNESDCIPIPDNNRGTYCIPNPAGPNRQGTIGLCNRDTRPIPPGQDYVNNNMIVRPPQPLLPQSHSIANQE